MILNGPFENCSSWMGKTDSGKNHLTLTVFEVFKRGECFVGIKSCGSNPQLSHYSPTPSYEYYTPIIPKPHPAHTDQYNTSKCTASNPPATPKPATSKRSSNSSVKKAQTSNSASNPWKPSKPSSKNARAPY